MLAIIVLSPLKCEAERLTRNGVHSGYPGEEVTGESVATSGGCRVWSIAGNHVVNCRHVNGEL